MADVPTEGEDGRKKKEERKPPISLKTENDLEYHYFPKTTRILRFKFKGPYDAHIILATSEKPSPSDPVIEVVIGCNKNEATGLWRDIDVDSTTVPTKDICSKDEFRGFWINYEEENCVVGKENEKEPFLTWRDPLHYFIPTYFGVKTGEGNSGEWIIETEDPEDEKEPKPAEELPKEKEKPKGEKKSTEESPKEKEKPKGEKKSKEDHPEEKGKPDETKEKSKPEKQQDSKKMDVKPLFDSKGSLLVSESYAKTTLEELKEKRAAVAALIRDLQAKVMAFKKKDNPTDEDVANLRKYHAQFLDKIAEYEEMTRNVERLMGMPEVSSSQITVTSIESPIKTSDGLVNEKLKEAHEAQKKLAEENYEINQMRLKMQQELFAKQELLENMKQQMLAYECENYRIQNENCDLQRKLMCSRQPSGEGEGKICKRELYMKFRGQSPDDLRADNTQSLEQELERMGGDVQSLCCQLECLQSDKASLGYPTSPRKPICKRMLPQKSTQTDEDKERDICFETDTDPKYRELREQYMRLHSDFKNKVAEVASLRVDLEKTRTELDDITILHHELEALHQQEIENNRSLEAEQSKMMDSKDRILDLEQMASFAKQMYSSCSEELEEMKALIEDQATQLDEYRNKYMKTLQIAEELKKENEFMEIECANKLAVEVQKVKVEMQDTIKELVPIKELLRVTQQKLKETEQMHTIALETIAQLSERVDLLTKELEMAQVQIEGGGGGYLVDNLQHSLEVAEIRLTELEKENDHLKEMITQLEHLQSQKMQQLEEKGHEVQLLLNQLETLREESARQVSRLKDRNNTIRKCLQAQVAEMEGELAMCRAETSCANKERDEIRSKLQLEICMLSENFRESQNRILQLQQHVNYLSASHPTAFIDLCKELQ